MADEAIENKSVPSSELSKPPRGVVVESMSSIGKSVVDTDPKVDPHEQLQRKLRAVVVEDAIGKLRIVKDRDVVRKHFGIGQGKESLEEIAQEERVTRERVRQREGRALGRLRNDRHLREETGIKGDAQNAKRMHLNGAINALHGSDPKRAMLNLVKAQDILLSSKSFEQVQEMLDQASDRAKYPEVSGETAELREVLDLKQKTRDLWFKLGGLPPTK